MLPICFNKIRVSPIETYFSSGARSHEKSMTDNQKISLYYDREKNILVSSSFCAISFRDKEIEEYQVSLENINYN